VILVRQRATADLQLYIVSHKRSGCFDPVGTGSWFVRRAVTAVVVHNNCCPHSIALGTYCAHRILGSLSRATAATALLWTIKHGTMKDATER
jgi:hypothetical protein